MNWFLFELIYIFNILLLVPSGSLCPSCIDNAGLLDWTLLNLDFFNPGAAGQCYAPSVIKINFTILGSKCCCGGESKFHFCVNISTFFFNSLILQFNILSCIVSSFLRFSVFHMFKTFGFNWL